MVFVAKSFSVPGFKHLINPLTPAAFCLADKPCRPKRSGDTTSPASSDNLTNVSTNRTDSALISLQKESEIQRMEEQLLLINRECRRSQGSRDQCHTVCLRAKTKRNTDTVCHRNQHMQAHMPLCKKITCLNKTNYFKEGFLNKLQVAND